MECLTPFYLTHKLGDSLPVPCGKCPNCKKRRAAWWGFRLMQESKHSTSSYVLTLTYDIPNVPITKSGFMSLSKPGKDANGRAIGSHLQSFFKRLRKRSSRKISRSIKYYSVGEYGDGNGNTRTRRPHYHIIIFNVQLEDLIDAKDIKIIQRHGWDSKRHVRILDWHFGHASIDICEPKGVMYCLKYISKERDIPLFQGDDRVPPFAAMSKGLGMEYLSREWIAWHLADKMNRMFVHMDGYKISMPRYYKDKLYGKELREEIGKYVRARMEEKNVREWVMLSPEEKAMRSHGYAAGVEAAFRKMYKESALNNQI